jgi:transposase-like protein
MAKWINARGWLKGYVSQKEARPVNISQPAANLESGNTVMRLVLRCPRCRSQKVKCYGADRPVLYYRCSACKWKFKVLEVDKP